jgi:enoyl-CoA hydratase/carnithine racemase
LFCTTPGIEVARAISRKKAMEMLLTGQPISAQEALQHGLINKIVPADQLDQETRNMATNIVGASFDTIALGKRAFYRQVEMNVDEAYNYGGQIMVENMKTDDCKEGIGAFVQKRHPTWKY